MKKPYPLFFWLSILITIFIVFFTPFHTQDGPNHKKDTLILSRLDSSPIEAKVYKSGLGILNTNTLFSLLYLPFKKILSIDTYEKIFFAFFLISIVALYRLFLQVWSKPNLDLWPLMLPFLFHPLFLRGMYNYTASVAITLLALIVLYKGMETKSWKYVLSFFLLCWLGQLAHPFTFILLSLVLAVQYFLSWKKDFKHFLPFAAIVFLFMVIGFVLPLFGSGIGVKTSYDFRALTGLIAALLASNFMDYSVLHFILPFPFLISLLVIAIKNIREQGFTKNSLWICTMLAFFIFPCTGGGSAYTNERFLPFIFFFFPLALDQLQSVWRKRVVILAFVTFLMVSGGVGWGMYQVDKEVKNAKLVLKNLPKMSRLYPINFNLTGPSLFNGDLYHTWADYEDDRIVFSPYLFALPKLTPLLKPIPNKPDYFPALDESYAFHHLAEECKSGWLYDTTQCDLWREQSIVSIFQDAQYYDYWLVHEPPKDFRERLEKTPGLKLVGESSTFSLWHYEKALPFNPPVP